MMGLPPIHTKHPSSESGVGTDTRRTGSLIESLKTRCTASERTPQPPLPSLLAPQSTLTPHWRTPTTRTPTFQGTPSALWTRNLLTSNSQSQTPSQWLTRMITLVPIPLPQQWAEPSLSRHRPPQEWRTHISVRSTQLLPNLALYHTALPTTQ